MSAHFITDNIHFKHFYHIVSCPINLQNIQISQIYAPYGTLAIKLQLIPMQSKLCTNP